MFRYSLRVIDEPKMSEIRILNLCHKKSILVDFYRQSLLKILYVIPPPFKNSEKPVKTQAQPFPPKNYSMT